MCGMWCLAGARYSVPVARCPGLVGRCLVCGVRSVPMLRALCIACCPLRVARGPEICARVPGYGDQCPGAGATYGIIGVRCIVPVVWCARCPVSDLLLGIWRAGLLRVGARCAVCRIRWAVCRSAVMCCVWEVRRLAPCMRRAVCGVRCWVWVSAMCGARTPPCIVSVSGQQLTVFGVCES